MKRPKHGKNTIQRKRLHTQAVVRRRFRKVKIARKQYAFGLGIILSVVAIFVLWRSPDFLTETQTEVRFFQISTGPTGSAYYSIGRQIATVVSRPPGAESCESGGPCGVEGVLAVGKASHGSIANARGVNTGRVQSALIQSDIANWAYQGVEMFKREGALKNLRAIASLYPETIHLVASYDANINSFKDLRGKKIAIDRVGSGTNAIARRLLRTFGIPTSKVKLLEIEPSRASDMLLRGELDAFFSVSGTPSPIIQETFSKGHVKLISIEGKKIERFLKKNPYLKKVIISNVYEEFQTVNSLTVNALWVTNINMSTLFVAELTEALLLKENQKLLSGENKIGKNITLNTAKNGISIPLHPGAKLYYDRQAARAVSNTQKAKQ